MTRTKAFADVKKAMPTLGNGTVRNGWSLATTMGVYGTNWLLRTLVKHRRSTATESSAISNECREGSATVQDSVTVFDSSTD